MCKKTTVLYDDTFSQERDDEVRDYLFYTYAEENDWDNPSQVPYSEIEREEQFVNEDDWRYFTYKLRTLLETQHCIVVGTCGTWHGRLEGGRFVDTIADFSSFIKHLDNIRVCDVDGHLYIEGYHHDGQDFYELKVLTPRGYQHARNNCFAHTRELHHKLMESRNYTSLPRLAMI